MSLSVDRVLRKADRLAKTGDTDLAAREYELILEKYPNNRLAREGLEKLQQLKPPQREVQALVTMLNQGRLQETLLQGEVLAKRFPNTPFIVNVLGAACFSLGRSEQAEAHFRRALELKPDYAIAHNNLGNAQKMLGKSEDAVASYKKAIGFDPDYVSARRNLASALSDVGRHSEAATCYKKLLRLKPDDANAHNDLGIALVVLGKSDAAKGHFDKALQLQPDFAEAHRNISEAKTYRAGDDQLQQMLQLVDRRGLADKDRALLSFALGKAYDDMGDHDKAFACLAEGNRLAKEQRKYDISVDRELLAEIKSRFADDVPVVDVDSDAIHKTGQIPVFILGMPRSGTTLVEQILASHSQVYGAGEIGLLDHAIGAAEGNSGPVSIDQLQSIRQSYLSGLTSLEASKSIVTNKLPGNFQRIGFILAAMPEAKIIHVTRDARATCWSIFRNFFSGAGNDFSHDLEDIANYYNLYADLMSFWHDRFSGRIYDLGYEILTEQQESETRRLVEHLGVAWEDQCLEYHKTQRAVRTASAGQVRRKMYQGSSQEWRKYEKYLQPMLRILNP